MDEDPADTPFDENGEVQEEERVDTEQPNEDIDARLNVAPAVEDVSY